MFDEPFGDALEARPPERPHPGLGERRPERLLPGAQQHRERVPRQLIGMGAHEALDGGVDHAAALGGAGIGVDGIERDEPQNVAGIDGVGIAHQGLDLGHREAARPGIDRRARRRRRHRLDGFGPVERRLPAEPALALGAVDRSEQRRALVAACRLQRVLQLEQPARGHTRRALHPVGAGQQHLGRREALDEIVGGKADAPLRRGQAERGAHGPAQPRVGARIGGPGSLVEAAEAQEIGVLQPCLQGTPDVQPGMQPVGGAHHLGGHQRLEQRRIVAPAHRREARRRGLEPGDEGGRRLARLARPQPLGAGFGGAGGKRLGEGDMGRHETDEFLRPGAAHRRQERRRAPGQPVEPVAEPAIRLIAADHIAEPFEAGRRARTAQGGKLQRPRPRAERARLDAAGGEGMLEQGQQRKRRRVGGGEFRRQPQEHAGRRVGEGDARGIVDLDLPTPQLGGDAPRETPVRGHQRRGAAGHLERPAQGQGDHRRLLLRPGAGHEPHPLERIPRQGGRGGARLFRRRCRCRRRTGGGQRGIDQRHPRRRPVPGERCIPRPHLGGCRAEPGEQANHGELGMGGSDRGELVAAKGGVETGQHHQAGRKMGDDVDQIGGRRDAAGRARRDHRRRGR